MNELTTQNEYARNEPASTVGLDAQLTELIECVWACEVAARREACIDVAIGLRVKAIRWGGGLKAANSTPGTSTDSRLKSSANSACSQRRHHDRNKTDDEWPRGPDIADAR